MLHNPAIVRNMNYIPSLEYPESERPTLLSLKQLFLDWQDAINQHSQSFEDYTSSDFVFDGFYPYYFAQPVRVLFVGRESRGLSGHNYIEVLHQCYTQSLPIGSQSLNQAKFHRLLFYVTYALNNPSCDWSDIPYPSEMSRTFAKPKGLSFAFMNISKFSNERVAWQAIPELMDCSISTSRAERNFIRDQVRILRPNVIVTMNLGQSLELLGDGLQLLERSKEINAYQLDIGKPCLLLDSFHFSAVSKPDRECYVDPIRAFAERYKPVWSSPN